MLFFTSPARAELAVAAESQLRQVFSEIEGNRIHNALEKTDRLIVDHPNFRLAHLIRGDLLLARAQPLSTFGNASLMHDELDGLREEARARITALRTPPDVDNQLPRDLLQLSARHRHALVVDTARARVYVFRNEAPYPRLVADFYASYGKAGSEKQYEGDNRTPLGVYRVTSHIPASRLPDFYGTGAFPIDYPNLWDRRRGRTGHGIWLHGSPSETYARPPRSSEGCVVLANDDLLRLGDFIEPGVTPVIIGSALEWLPREQWRSKRDGLLDTLERWRADWQSLDVDRYLAHYGRGFHSGRQDLAAWSEHKRRVGNAREWVEVKLADISILRHPAEEGLIEVLFEQHYRSNGLNDRMRKRQLWQLEEGQWRIIFEGAA